jgi:hypothetical protein
VIANDTLAGVRRLVPDLNVVEIEVENPGEGEWFADLRRVEGVNAVTCEDRALRVTVQSLAEATPRVLVWLGGRGHRAVHSASQRADLETEFLTLTGRSVRNA